MIAMALGSFVLGGIITVYVSNKNTYTLGHHSALMDESARVALRAVTKHLEHAGYTSRIATEVENYVLPTDVSLSSEVCADGTSSISKLATVKVSSDDFFNDEFGDSVGVVFEADDILASDCTGSSLPSSCSAEQTANIKSGYVYNSFFVKINTTEKDSLGNKIPIFYCGGSRNPVIQPIVQGVENMQILYGIDTNADSSVDRYLSAGELSGISSTLWRQILSIQVGILVRSLEPVYSGSTAHTYQVLDKVIHTNDRYKRNVYTTTVRLRNVGG